MSGREAEPTRTPRTGAVPQSWYYPGWERGLGTPWQLPTGYRSPQEGDWLGGSRKPSLGSGSRSSHPEGSGRGRTSSMGPSGEPTQNIQSPSSPPPTALSLSAVAGGHAELRSTPRHVLAPNSRLLPSPLLHLSEHSHKYLLLIFICTKYILSSLQEPQKTETFLITLEFPLIINLGAIINKFM